MVRKIIVERDRARLAQWSFCEKQGTSQAKVWSRGGDSSELHPSQSKCLRGDRMRPWSNFRSGRPFNLWPSQQTWSLIGRWPAERQSRWVASARFRTSRWLRNGRTFIPNRFSGPL